MDLKTLESGIVIDFPMTRRVKCGVLCYAGDNLEISLVGGFSACFSSKDVCRVCHIQHKELESHIHDFDDVSPHKYWSEHEYDRIVQSIDNEEEESEPPQIEDVNPENLFSGDEESDIEQSDSADSDSEDNISDSEDRILNKRGIKSKCPLNILTSFHRDELLFQYLKIIKILRKAFKKM